MNNLKYTLILVFLTVSNAFTQQKLNADVSKSIINWTGHAEIGNYAPAGTLTLKSGVITVKNNTVTAADIIINMTTLKQDNEDLTAHLKDEEFFDVKKYPVCRVVITAIRNGMASGSLTVKNKTGKISFPVKSVNTNGALIITGTATIDRTKYGIVYNSTSFFADLGDRAIRNTFEIAFTLVVPKNN